MESRIGRHFLETLDVTEDEAHKIDALCGALDPAPSTRDEACEILDRFLGRARPRPI